MKLTEEQIERARTVNLPDFLMSHGVELKKTGRSYVMKEHDSLNIKDNAPGEHGKWYRFSTGEGGDNISFVQQYMNSTFVEAVEMLNNERYDREFQSQYRPHEHHEEPVRPAEIHIEENEDMKRVFGYLCSTRGISSDIISDLAARGKITQEAKTGNVVFRIFDENNKLVGAEKVGTSTQHKYKGIATGSASGYGFELCTGNGEKAVFFESAIDLISFYQMYRNILSNHRLVSMMGVKPSVVTETMERYSISPKNVFLASDNDTAGNDFADRLIGQYPEMNRMKTPDRFKDWNDYIRNIPKEEEVTKEESHMVTYGNEIWSKATDNKEKSLVTMYADTFLDLQKKLEETGINYFAYERDNIVTMAVNEKDTAWLGRIADLDSLEAKKSEVEYSPPEKNIFGNTEYRYIPQKEYISLDSDSVLKMADMLVKQNISFSGRIYANGKGTLTVSRNDIAAVKSVQASLAEMRRNYSAVEKKSEVIGNTAYRNIRNKQYIYSKLTPEIYNEIKEQLGEGVAYSGLIRDNKIIFTVDKNDAQLFNDRIAELTVKPDKEVEILSDNTVEIPFDRKFAAEIKTVKDEMRLHDNLMELASVSAGNNDVYDFHFSEDLMEEIKKTGNEEFINTLIPNGVLDDRLMMEIFEDVYKELFSQGQALAAEETGMDNLRRPVKLPDTVGIKFTQRHPSSPELDNFINETMADKEISFALASAVIEYLDDKHRYERINVPELEWYHETEFALNVLVDSNHLSYSARYDIGEGKYTGGGSLADFIAYDAKELHSREKIDDNTLTFINDVVVPFLKEKSTLSQEEEKIFEDFKARHPVRQESREENSIQQDNSNKKEGEVSTFRIYQLKEGEEYHYARFTDYQTNKDAGANLNISDYDLKYEDSWDEVPGISSEMKLDAIFHRFNTNHPNDFTGHSLSVSDVIVVGNGDSQTAYYVDDFGFTDFPEFFKEKEKTVSHEDISEPAAVPEENTEQEQDTVSDNSWIPYIIPDLSTWAISTEKNTPIERFDNIDDALKRFAELRKEPYNSENKPNPWDNSSMARLTIGLESTDGVNAADIVHVRDGKNYLVDDFTRLDRLNSHQSFIDTVKKISDTVGIDRINLFERGEDGKFLPPRDIDFRDWNNTFFAYEPVHKDDIPVSVSDPESHSAEETSVESDNDALETAKQLINRFCIEEYDSEADFSDLTNIGLAYTTNDDEQEIQVSANLVEFSLNTYVGGKLIDSEMYAGIADMNENVFTDMDFNELVYKGMSYESQEPEIGDKPLFAEAYNTDFEDIDSENKFESEMLSGDQLNMFGDSVPYASSDSKPFIPKEIFVGGVDTLEALSEEIMHGSGIEGGKFRIEKFYRENHPDNKTFADFLKNEYGVGGHSAADPISFVDHDSKGLEFSVRGENGEYAATKFSFKWPEVARRTAEIINSGEYITDRDINRRIFHAKWDLANRPDEEIVTKRAAEVLAEYTEERIKQALDTYTYSARQSLIPAEQVQDEVLSPVGTKSEKGHEPEQITDENFRIEDAALGEGGPKTRFRKNIEAIKTLQLTEAENRPATEVEKEVLSGYAGWGGIPMAFDRENESWANEYSELKALLSDSEYRSARASTLDSFYTSPVIIESMYEALESFGFKGGNLLEPACGIGNYIGCIPENIAGSTKTYGVEIDSISGRIAQKLYPEADIQIKGFEDTKFQDGCFDAAVGNVPFGDTNIRYNDESLKIHDFFFAQSVDKVKEGGIIAFVTSTGTLDKKSETFRTQLAEKADLIGAVRLPSGAFKANAGTDVTSDIIFMQKRSSPPEHTPEWVHVSENEKGLPVNSYFAEHPDMILGELTEDSNPFGSGTKVKAFENSDLKSLLSEAVSKLHAEISDVRTADVYDRKPEGAIEAPEELRNFSYFKKDNKIWYKSADEITEFRYGNNASACDRASAFIDIRDTTRGLLTAQEQNQSDFVISSLQEKLNSQYDDFYKKYGLLHSQTNRKYFSPDISYNLVLSLEKSFEKDKLIEKSDIFTKRTIQPAMPVTHVDTPLEALALSSAEKAKVDFEYMSSLTGLTRSQLISELHGEIFQVPGESGVYQTANEYLSGDIREKLNTATAAAEEDLQFKDNVTALEFVMPEPLKAGDIDIKLGAAWIDTAIYDKFMYETFETPRSRRNDIKRSFFDSGDALIETDYCKQTGVFYIQNKNLDKSVNVMNAFGTKNMSAYEIMESLLNLKEPKITKIARDPVTGVEKRVVDIEATKIAQRKADKIRNAFSEWIFSDPERRDSLVNKYNELFNSIRPREYDGSNLTFPNMNAEIHLHEHQKNAIAHALFGGNTLFAHSVGAGKSATRS